MANKKTFCFYVSKDYMNTYFIYEKLRGMSSKHFCKFLKINPKTYFGSVVRRYYDYHTRQSISIYKVFKKYYRKEFNTYENYLEQHLHLSAEKRDIVINSKKFHIKRLQDDKDYYIHNFEYDDELPFGNPTELLYRFFEKDVTNEN